MTALGDPPPSFPDPIMAVLETKPVGRARVVRFLNARTASSLKADISWRTCQGGT